MNGSTEVTRNVGEQAHRPNQSDSAPVSIKERHTVPEDPGHLQKRLIIQKVQKHCNTD
jgi:hypothetical protein